MATTSKHLSLLCFSLLSFAMFVIGRPTTCKSEEYCCSKVQLDYPGRNIAAFYNDIIVENSDRGTTFVVCGWNSVDFGLFEQDDRKRVVLLRFPITDASDKDAEKETKVTFTHPEARLTEKDGVTEIRLTIDWKESRPYRFLVSCDSVDGEMKFNTFFFHERHEKWTKFATLECPQSKGGMKDLRSSISGLELDRFSVLNERSATFGNGYVLNRADEWNRLNAAVFIVEKPEGGGFDGGKLDGRFYLETGGDYYNGGWAPNSRIQLGGDKEGKTPKDVERLLKREK
jgi:hypothetical protein